MFNSKIIKMLALHNVNDLPTLFMQYYITKRFLDVGKGALLQAIPKGENDFRGISLPSPIFGSVFERSIYEWLANYADF